MISGSQVYACHLVCGITDFAGRLSWIVDIVGMLIVSSYQLASSIPSQNIEQVCFS